MKILFKTVALCMILIMLQIMPALAEQMTIEVNKSIILDVEQAEKVAIANPEIADIVVSGKQVVVIGKKPGVTSLQIWNHDDVAIYDVYVQDNAALLTEILHKDFGYPDISAIKQDKTIILKGTVDNQEQKAKAESVAAAYGDKVVDLVEAVHNYQIKIEAKVVEISCSKLKKLGVEWGNDAANPGTFKFGQSSTNSVSSQSGKLRWFGTYSDINSKINALVENGSATVLSQPNVITTSGSKASILVGGEIAVPVSANNGEVTVEWKSYGIKLFIEPQVNSEGIITSKVKAEVSSLDYTNTNTTVKFDNYVIPALKTNQAETIISLASGQPMIIGGMLSSDVSRSMDKMPLLGDLPLVGNLFKNKSTSTERKEIVILITPTLISDNEYQPPVSDIMRDTLQRDQKGANYGQTTPKSFGNVQR